MKEYNLLVLLVDNDNAFFMCEDLFVTRKDLFGEMFSKTTTIGYMKPSEFINKFEQLQKVYKENWLIILDIDLPNYNNYDVLKDLANNNANLNDIDMFILTYSNTKINIEHSNKFPCIKGYFGIPLLEDKIKEELDNLRL